MSDTIRCTESLSPMFHGESPTQRPNDVVCRQHQRAFVVSAVSTDPPAPTKRTEGLAHPQKGRAPASWRHAPGLGRVRRQRVAAGSRKSRRVWQLGESASGPGWMQRSRVSQSGTTENDTGPARIRIPKSPYVLNLKGCAMIQTKARLARSHRHMLSTKAVKSFVRRQAVAERTGKPIKPRTRRTP